MKCYRDLFKKKKIKTMDNKMPRNTYLSAISSENQTKQTGRGETEDGWEGHMGEWVKR